MRKTGLILIWIRTVLEKVFHGLRPVRMMHGWCWTGTKTERSTTDSSFSETLRNNRIRQQAKIGTDFLRWLSSTNPSMAEMLTALSRVTMESLAVCVYGMILTITVVQEIQSCFDAAIRFAKDRS